MQLRNLGALLVIGLAAHAPCQGSWWSTRVENESLAKADILVGKFVGSWSRVHLPILQARGFRLSEQLIECFSRKFEVEGASESRNILVPIYPGAEPWKETKGRVLLLGHRASEGRSGDYSLTADAGSSLNVLTLGGAKEGDFAAMYLHDFGEFKAPIEGNVESILMALVESVDQKYPADYRNLCRLLAIAHPPYELRANAYPAEVRSQYFGPISKAMIEVCANRRIVDLLDKSITEAAGEYQRSRLLELRFRWRIPGSAIPYRESLRKLLKDPKAYAEPEEVGYGWGPIEFYGTDLRAIDGYLPYEVGRWLADLSGATNPILRLHFLKEYGNYLAPDHLPRFALLLNVKDRKFVCAVASLLANITGTPEQAPKAYGVVDGVSVDYPDLDEKVAYWKKRFGIDKIVDRAHPDAHFVSFK